MENNSKDDSFNNSKTSQMSTQKRVDKRAAEKRNANKNERKVPEKLYSIAEINDKTGDYYLEIDDLETFIKLLQDQVDSIKFILSTCFEMLDTTTIVDLNNIQKIKEDEIKIKKEKLYNVKQELKAFEKMIRNQISREHNIFNQIRERIHNDMMNVPHDENEYTNWMNLNDKLHRIEKKIKDNEYKFFYGIF